MLLHSNDILSFCCRYLAAYEKLHFLGEDGDDNSSDGRKTMTAAFFTSSGMNFNHGNFHGVYLFSSVLLKLVSWLC